MSVQSIQQGTAPLTINFNDTSIGDGLTYFWDFGDGNSSTDKNPTHTFINGGVYSVSLAVSNDNGSDIKSVPIVVASGGNTGGVGGNTGGIGGNTGGVGGNKGGVGGNTGGVGGNTGGVGGNKGGVGGNTGGVGGNKGGVGDSSGFKLK